MSRIMSGAELMARMGAKTLPSSPTPRLPRPKLKTKKVFKDWTAEEDALLARLWGERVVLRKMAVAIGRTLEAVKTRRVVLGLPPRCGKDFRGIPMRLMVSPEVARDLDALCADHGVSRGEMVGRMVRKETS